MSLSVRSYRDQSGGRLPVYQNLQLLLFLPLLGLLQHKQLLARHLVFFVRQVLAVKTQR